VPMDDTAEEFRFVIAGKTLGDVIVSSEGVVALKEKAARR
jgi:hypothetical protein